MEKDVTKGQPPSSAGETPPKQRGVYLTEDISLDDYIFRYTDLDSLLQILSGTFYVPAKEGFKQYDSLDAGRKLIYLYLTAFSAACEEPAPPKSKEEIEKEKLLSTNMRMSKGFLASCWTTTRDSYLMWRAYTSGTNGVIIKSCVHDVIASLKTMKDYYAYCVKMSYDGYYYGMPFVNYLFTKNRFYQDEKEIRFYFLPKKIEEYNTPPTDEELAKRAVCTGEFFKIEPAVMISEIILSPFMRGNSFKELKDLLEGKYSFLKGKIKKSSIIVN